MKKNLKVVLISLIFSIILWVSISLSNEYYATVDIPVKLINFPDGYTTGTDIPKKVSIKLKGEGWKLVSVNLGAESDYTISAGNESGRRNVNLYNYLAENQWLSSDIEVIDISPDTLSFFVEKISERKAKILPNLNLNFKPGYGLASEISISPESTLVYGPESYIKNLKIIPTEELELTNIDSKITEQVRLKEMPGMVYDVSSATVYLDIQKIVDKNFNNIPVEVLDVPSDRDVVLLPNKINVGLRGGIDLLGKINNNNIKAYVYYRDVVLDTLGSIVPKIEFPDNTSLLYNKPDRLRYIIKKF